MCALKKNDSRGANSSTSRPRAIPLLHVGKAVLEREGQLLLRGRAGLADVVAGDRDRMPARGIRRAQNSTMSVTSRMAGSIGKHHSLPVLALRVVLDRARQVLRPHALALSGDHVEGQHHRRRRVDRHRRRHRAHVDPAEQGLHVVERVRRARQAPPRPPSARGRGRGHPARRHVESRRAPSGRGRAGSGSARWFPPQCRSPRTGASSTSARDTSTDRRRACGELSPGKPIDSGGSSGAVSGSTGSPLNVVNSSSRWGRGTGSTAIGKSRRARQPSQRAALATPPPAPRRPARRRS